MQGVKHAFASLSLPMKIAIVLGALLLIWLFVIGDIKRAKTDAPDSPDSSKSADFVVEVRTSNASESQRQIKVNGQVQPWRNVTVKADVAGRIARIEKGQGASVNKGEALLTLTDEGRSTALKQAKAQLNYRTLELDSAKKLKTSQFVSDAELSRLESEQASAEAELDRATLALEKSVPAAPFSGIVDRRYVDAGDQVAVGDTLVDLVQIDKLKVTAFVPQQRIDELRLGQAVDMRLLNGDTFQGKLSFISSVADTQTRSYFIEVELDNPENKRIAGASVELSLSAPSLGTHALSPALLKLNASGKLGVYTVNDADVVEYHQIEVVSIGDKAVVSGLPNIARIITSGAGFVDIGDKVTTVEKTP